MTHTRSFQCRPDSVTAARRFVREVLSGLPREVIDAAELMTSELTTNSVRHAETGFELAIHLQGQIRIEVRDCGSGRPTRLAPSPQDPSGRGLRIVESLSEAWGFAPAQDGKTVWFTLARPDAALR